MINFTFHFYAKHRFELKLVSYFAYYLHILQCKVLLLRSR